MKVTSYYFLLALMLFVSLGFDCSKGNNPRPTEAGQAYYVPTGRGFTDSLDDIHDSLSRNGVSEERSNFIIKDAELVPGGPHYYSVVEIPQKFKQGLIDALNWQIARYDSVFTNPHWGNYDEVRDYDFLVVTGTAKSVDYPGAPLMFVQGVSTCGTNIGNSGKPKIHKPYIVLLQQEYILFDHPDGRRERQDFENKWSQYDLWAGCAQNESEHIRESVNDRTVFTYFAIAGDSHPHQIPIPE